MSVDKTLAKIDALVASLENHWMSPCCHSWHVVGQRNPWPVTCCGTRYEVNADRRTWRQ